MMFNSTIPQCHNFNRFACSSTCTCDAGCTAHGNYLLERASFSFEGGECRCGFDDPPEDPAPSSHEPNAPPSLTITFSKQAVIFEDAYEDSPGVTKPRRSTRVRLTIDAYGGSGGGTLSLSEQNMGKLAAVGGGAVPLPYTQGLAEGETYHATCIYEGAEASAGQNDVVVSGSLIPNLPYNVQTAQAALTAVEVALEAEYVARDNRCQSRHTYGVGERVNFTVAPKFSSVSLSAVKADTTDWATPYDTFGSEVFFLGVSNVDASQTRTYICPATASRPSITVMFSGVEYKPVMTIVEPDEIVTPFATGSWDLWPSQVGFGCMTMENYIGPFNVSFKGVKFSEIPCEEVIPPTGFFATSNYTGELTHNVSAGAGGLLAIQDGNYWRHDDVGHDYAIDNWSAGTLVWKIPIGWKRYRYEGDDLKRAYEPDYEQYMNATTRPLLIGGRTDYYTQTLHIDTNGTTTLEKFGWRMTRSRWSFSGTVERIE